MASTVFVDYQTVIPASWLNDVNNLVYNGTVPATTFTMTNAVINGTLSGTGVSTYLASPPAIGGTAANTVRGTTITATTQFTGSGAGLTSIPNSALTNSSITINGSAISLGGSVSVGTVTSVSGTTGRITSTGGATPVIDLASGIVTAGTTGSATLIPVVTVDTYGRITSITTAANPQGTVTSVGGTGTVNGLTLTGTVTSTGNLTLGGTLDLSSPPAIGATAPNTGKFTTLTSTSDASLNGLTVGKGAGSVATNTAVGASALAANTSGDGQTSVGYQAGAALTTGSNNTAIGRLALATATTSSLNTAIGYASLYLNTTGANNTSIGGGALQNNTIASNNTAVGYQAGYSVTSGDQSVFVGTRAGYSTTGTNNTLVGYQSGYSLTTGVGNTFIGNGYNIGSGYYVTTGSKNTIVGGYTGNSGGLDIRTASNYVVLSDGDGIVRLWINQNGYLTCAGVYALTTANAANMYVDSGGSIYRSTSALKYKKDVRDVEDFDISKLRPVRYKSKGENDDQTKDHFGLIADEAAEAGFEELVTRGADGEVEGFQYERLTVVLLKKLQTLDAEFKAYVAAHP